MKDIFIFIAFIVVYIFYIWATNIVLTKYINHLKDNRLLESELLIIIPNLFLFAFLFIIGRFFNIKLVIISIIFSNIGLLIAFIIWNLLGSPKVPYKAISGWAGFNFGIKNIWFGLSTLALSVLILVVYPLAIGRHYFTSISYEDIRLFTLKSTLILILSSYFLLIPTVIAVLSSSFIDEDSRARYLISQFTGLITNALFISLLFWTFNFGSFEKGPIIGSININFNPLLFACLIAFFLIFFLLPYFIGLQKAKQLEDDYLEIKNDIFSHLIEAIDLSTEKNIMERLDSILEMVTNKFLTLKKDEDRIIEKALQYDDLHSPEDLNKEEIVIYKFYKEARPFDKRFIYYDFLSDIYQTVNELKTALATETNVAIQKETLKAHGDFFKVKKKEINDNNEKSNKSNPALWVGLIAITSPFVSQLMSESGKYLIEYFKKI